MSHGGLYDPNLLRTPQERIQPKSDALKKIEERQLVEAAKRKKRKKVEIRSANVFELKDRKRKVK